MLSHATFPFLPSFYLFSYFTRLASSWLIFSSTELLSLFLLHSACFLVAHFLLYRAFLAFLSLLGLLPRGSLSPLPSFSRFSFFARLTSSWLIFSTTELFYLFLLCSVISSWPANFISESLQYTLTNHLVTKISATPSISLIAATKTTSSQNTIMTTRQTGGLLAPIRGSYRPASKDAGFHFVQALTPLTRRSP